MSLRYRPMQPEDVEESVRIVAEHPVIGPRYGPTIRHLSPAWLRLLHCEAKTAGVFEEVQAGRPRICSVGVVVFVCDEFLAELKRPPLVWWGPELAKRIVQGVSPVLSDHQLRAANSCGGLNLLSWEAPIRPEFERRSDVHREMIEAFIELHRGFQWKEAICSQLESAERLQWALDSGGFLWDGATGCYVKLGKRRPEEVFKAPHLVGVTRELESRRPGSWVGALFDYHLPRLGFSRAEQRLLLSALSGGTDEKLAEELAMSPSTVKNTWRSIYDRAASRMPQLFSDDSRTDSRGSERGKERRRPLLAYLREHLEELRPVSKKLIEQATSRPRRALDA
jgi:hypothetical protein